jgi:hypothetical protein
MCQEAWRPPCLTQAARLGISRDEPINLAALCGAVETAGIQFIPENGGSGSAFATPMATIRSTPFLLVIVDPAGGIVRLRRCRTQPA